MPTRWTERAERTLAKAWAHLGERLGLRPGRRAIRLANAARDRRDWPAAVAAYAEALRYAPSSPAIWVQYGHALKERGDIAGAEAAYRSALDKQPQDPDASLHLAHVLALHAVAVGERREWAVAASMLAEAVELAPQLGSLWTQLGHALKEIGRLDEAESAYRRSLALAPAETDPSLHLAWLLVDRAGPAREAGDWLTVAAAFTEARDLAPAVAAFSIQLGHALKEAGDLAGAETAYREALSQEPRDIETLVHLAELLRRRGRSAEAAWLLLDGRRHHPGDRMLLTATGRVLRLYLRELGSAANAAITLQLDAAGTEAQVALPSLLALAEEDSATARLAADLLVKAGQREPAAALLGAVLWRDPADAAARDALMTIKAELNRNARQRVAAAHDIGPEELPASLRFIAFGTTGVCNASCIHCPTNKPETEQVPRVTMPMPLFERIVREIAALHLSVRTQLSFGLFGDALIDPLVVQRLHLVRRLLPEVRISVNTNGAAYSPARHKALFEQTSIIALHCESLRADVYDRLMAPLRLRNVLPKIEAILRDFPGKVHVSIPVNRMNRDELPAMRRWFLERGAVEVQYDGLSSRCAEDRALFDSLAIAPVRIQCGPEIHEDLIVDCDGLVTICCNDFRREEPIGDLSKQSLLETLLSPGRRLMRAQFAAQRHDERRTCSRCYGDVRPVPA